MSLLEQNVHIFNIESVFQERMSIKSSKKIFAPGKIQSSVELRQLAIVHRPAAKCVKKHPTPTQRHIADA
jgi:hypothetical protein